MTAMATQNIQAHTHTHNEHFSSCFQTYQIQRNLTHFAKLSIIHLQKPTGMGSYCDTVPILQFVSRPRNQELTVLFIFNVLLDHWNSLSFTTLDVYMAFCITKQHCHQSSVPTVWPLLLLQSNPRSQVRQTGREEKPVSDNLQTASLK